MINLSTAQQTEIAIHGQNDYPHECCGLLLGSFAQDGAKTVTQTYPISNAREEQAKRNRFLITPAELIRGEKYATENHLEIVGFYHSHPDHPAVPSGYDLDHAWPVYSYVIVSVKQGQAEVIRSWSLLPDRSSFTEEHIQKGS
jgi:proteasome lid subunit RPN8/RPN11